MMQPGSNRLAVLAVEIERADSKFRRSDEFDECYEIANSAYIDRAMFDDAIRRLQLVLDRLKCPKPLSTPAAGIILRHPGHTR
jgi:hypothetical protein